MSLPKENERYTYQDYCRWSDEERWELIDGKAYDMTPSPNFRHQSILFHLSRIVGNALLGKPCVPLFAPTDVVLSESDVVQPDLLIVCDRTKITEKNIQGAPDVIFEILSPSTSKKDRWEKRALYEKYGVKEYILIDPDGRFVERFLLREDGRFDRGEMLDEKDTLTLRAVSEVEIPLAEVFEVDYLDENPSS